MTDAERLARIGRLTRDQAAFALGYLAMTDPETVDKALAHLTPPDGAVATVTPINANVQPAFCADCGSPEGLVPLVSEDGVCRCWDAERCDERQAVEVPAS